MSRWREIKRNFKLNNNLLGPKRGDAHYDPCGKYDLIFKALVHNMNYCTKTADMDCAVDESSWCFGGYCRETGGSRLMNKSFQKVREISSHSYHHVQQQLNYFYYFLFVAGGQTTMIYDVHHRYPHGYVLST